MTELEFEIFMDRNYGAVKKTMPVIYEHLRNIERLIKRMADVTFNPMLMSAWANFAGHWAALRSRRRLDALFRRLRRYINLRDLADVESDGR